MARLSQQDNRSRRKAATEREHGEELFANGLVQISGVDGSLLFLMVGSRHEEHIVLFDLVESSNEEIYAACDCGTPVAKQLCRHIWAAIREVEVSVIRQILPDCRHCQVTFDEELLEEIEGVTVTELQECANETRKHAPQVQDSFASQVRLIESDAETPRESFERALRLSTTKDQVPWYLVSVADSAVADTLCVRTFVGTDEHPTELILAVDDWSEARVKTTEDDHLLAVLLAAANFNEDDDDWDDWDHFSSMARSPLDMATYHVTPAVHSMVAECLSRTDRSCWVLDHSLAPRDATRLTWNGDARYQVRLHVEEDKQRAGWRVVARIHGGQDSFLLAEATLVLSSGLMIHDNQISLVEWNGVAPCRRLFLARTELFARYSERRELIEFLGRFEPEVSQPWPESLQGEIRRVQPTPVIRLTTLTNRGYSQLVGTISFHYSDTVETGPADSQTIFEDEDSDDWIARDFEFEAACHKQLAAYAYLPPRSREVDGFDLLFPERRLHEIIEYLIERKWIVECEGKRLRRFNRVSYSIASGIDWFELNADVQYEDIQAELPDLLDAARKQERFVRLADGSHGLVPQELLEQIQRLTQLGRFEESGVRFAPSQALLIESLLANVEDRVDRDNTFARFAKKLRSFSGIKPKAPPRGFHGALRPYQQVGLGWLNFLKEFYLGGCLADDMGLGKTVQVLCLLESRRVRRLKEDETRLPSLVVVPKSLVFNWLDEAQRFTPKLRVRAFHGSDREQVLAHNDFDVLVTTYGTMRRDIERLVELEFDYVVLDEAQAIKNPQSQTARASRVLNANHRLALTGTPIENHIGELWSIFEFLNPGILGTAAAFKSLMSRTDQDASTLKTIRDTVAPFILRRTKEVVLDELPEKSEQVFYCALEPKQRKLYNQLRDYYRQSLDDRVRKQGMAKAKIHVLEALLRLRQAACHPALVDEKYARVSSAKLEALMEQLIEVSSEGHKSLVFSQFTSFLDLIRQRLEKQGLQYCYLDGSTNRRGEVVKQFQSEDRFSVFLISLKAGGHGLNLTSADYVYLMDPWWNPAVEAQAIDRAHRLGQKRAVFAYRMIARDTVEERILELQERKKDLAEAIISSNQSLLQRLTAEDLRRLLS